MIATQPEIATSEEQWAGRENHPLPAHFSRLMALDQTRAVIKSTGLSVTRCVDSLK